MQWHRFGRQLQSIHLLALIRVNKLKERQQLTARLLIEKERAVKKISLKVIVVTTLTELTQHDSLKSSKKDCQRAVYKKLCLQSIIQSHNALRHDAILCVKLIKSE